MKKFLTVTLLIAVFVLSCDNGGKDPAHTHDWEWVVTIPATIEADGLETETCKTCGAINGTRPIAQLPDNPNEVKDRTTTVTGLLDNDSSATVQGNFDKAGIESAGDKIKNAINGAFGQLSTDLQRNNYRNLFSTGVTIIVEKTTDYDNWRTDGDGKTIYFNLNSIDKTDLYAIFVLAIRSIGTSQAEQG